MISKAVVCILLCILCLNKLNAQSNDSRAKTPGPGRVEAKIDKPLQAELLKMFEDDQQYRRKIDSVEQVYGRTSKERDSLWKLIEQADSTNVVKVKVILDRHGWVGFDRVGEEANAAIFLIIQHADFATQKKYLPMMRETVKDGNARASQLALLEDRVALREGRKQIYGTQITQIPETGEFFVAPLDDPDHVDIRRAAMGLGQLAEYVKGYGIQWNVEEYKKKLSSLPKK